MNIINHTILLIILSHQNKCYAIFSFFDGVNGSVTETSTYFSSLGRSSYFGLSLFTCVLTLHEAANSVAERKWSWMAVRQGADLTIYGKICSQQDSAAEAAKADASKPYRDTETQTDQRKGRDQECNENQVYFVCRVKLVNVRLSRIMCHCAHTK